MSAKLDVPLHSAATNKQTAIVVLWLVGGAASLVHVLGNVRDAPSTQLVRSADVHDDDDDDDDDDDGDDGDGSLQTEGTSQLLVSYPSWMEAWAQKFSY